MRAVTEQLDRPDLELDDLVGAWTSAGHDAVLFVRDGVGLAGRGRAATVPFDDATAFLAEVDHTGPAGGPVAIGALPFRPGAAAALVVPEVVVAREPDGRTWLTRVGSGALPDAALPEITSPTAASATYRVGPAAPVDRYLAAVSAARDAVRAGLLTKAVIAREVVIESDRPIDLHTVLRRLRLTFGSSYRYAVEGLVGASPELLVEVAGDTVRSHPLAGTAPRTGDPDRDAALAAELVASTKDQVEHRVVIETVHDTLLGWASYLDWEPEPSIVTVANVQHLGSAVEGRLSQPGPPVTELVRALSPTPALGGHPRDAALELIDRVEGVDRGRYGGAVGWVDARGDGTWAVTIRCADIDGHRARLVAGGGIVADSDPHAELAETQAKLQAMLGAIVRP